MEWIAEQIMGLIDFVNTGILDALGCDMSTFNTLFPIAQIMYNIFVAIGLGLLLLNFVWQLFKNFGLGLGIEAEDPLKLTMRSILFMLLVFSARDIVDIILNIAGKPYDWVMTASIPPLEFGNFMSFVTTVLAAIFNGPVLILSLIIIILLAWNYLKLLLEAAERYILLGVLVFTAPVAFGLGGAQSTANIFKNWCRMVGGQTFLLIMNAWCLKLFTNMVGGFIADPAQTEVQGYFFVWVLCAIGFLKVSQKIDSFMSSLGISVGHTGGSMLDDAIIAARGLSGAKKMAMAGFGKSGGLGGAPGAPSGNGSGGNGPGTFSGGLAGMVGRKIGADTASNLTASPGSEKGGIFAGMGTKSYNDSIGEEGGFAANVIGSVATGNAARNGIISGDKAADALGAYMGDTIPESAASGDASADVGMDSSIPMGEDVLDGTEELPMDDGYVGELPQETADIPMDPGDIAAGVAISEAMDYDEGLPSGVDPSIGPTGGIPTSGDNGASALIGADSANISSQQHESIPTSVDSGIADSSAAIEKATGMEAAPSIPAGSGVEAAGSGEGSVVSSTDAVEASSGIQLSGSQTIPAASGSAAGVSGAPTDGYAEAVQNTAFASAYSGGVSQGKEPPTYKNVTMGGGRITGIEVSPANPKGNQFAMYHTKQYSAPESEHTVVKSLDGRQWYKQYAQPDVKRTPISEKNGKVKYKEEIVSRLPKSPGRIDRI